MKPLALFAIAITFTALAGESSARSSAQSASQDPGAAQETATAPVTSTAAPPSKNQALIDAAKAAKARRKATSTRTITNADVKKAKGKLIVLDPVPKDDPATTPAQAAAAPKPMTFRERTAATERVEAAQKKVDELQKELDRLEQRYYEENDPNYRDDVIQKRFAQTKKQLDDARLELANARDAAGHDGNPSPK